MRYRPIRAFSNNSTYIWDRIVAFDPNYSLEFTFTALSFSHTHTLIHRQNWRTNEIHCFHSVRVQRIQLNETYKHQTLCYINENMTISEHQTFNLISTQNRRIIIFISLSIDKLCIIWICDVCIHSRHEAAETIGISDDNMLISLYTYDIRNQSCDFVTTITTAEGEANMRQRKKLFPANWGCTLQGICTRKHHWYTANNNDARKTKRATIDSFFHLNFVSMWEAYECVCMWYERKGKHINKKKRNLNW